MNTGEPIVAINNLARKIQTVGADGRRNAEVYELATELLIQAQHLRELTQERTKAEKTLADFIKRIKVRL